MAIVPLPCDCGGDGSTGLACTPYEQTGLCLADGTPIAVVTSRDCTTGAVTQIGWLNLTTGTYTAGLPPAGTVACGAGQSIQVSGVFCDVLADGSVAGLVLVEYHYDADGAIESVRLVNAATGATYVLQGTLSVCPEGTDDSVDSEPIVLCYGTPAGGLTTSFLRTFTYANGTVTATDTTLSGAPLVIPAGNLVGRCDEVDTEVYPMCVLNAAGDVVRHVLAVRRQWTDLAGHISTTFSDPVTGAGDTLAAGETYAACPGECLNCETLQLCDDTGDQTPALMTGAAASGTLPNGVGFHTRSVAETSSFPPSRNTATGSWWRMGIFPLSVTAPVRWTFDRPVDVEFTVVMISGDTSANGDRTQLPPGVELAGPLPAGYTYDPATRILHVTNRPGVVGASDPGCLDVTPDPNPDAGVRFRTTEPVTSLQVQYLGARIAICGQFGNYAFGAVEVTPAGSPFLRTICRDCDGEVTSVTDTTLDGETPYVPIGDVVPCLLDQCDVDVLAECTYHLPDVNTGWELEPAAFPDCMLGVATNPTYVYGDRVTSWEGTYQSNTGTISVVIPNSPDLGGQLLLANLVPALPVAPAESAPGYVGTMVVNGVTVTVTSVAGDGLSRQGTSGVQVEPGDRVRFEFSQPVRFTLQTTVFADPPTPHNERFCGVEVVTVPWNAIKLADCEGVVTYIDADTRLPLDAAAVIDSCVDTAASVCCPETICYRLPNVTPVACDAPAIVQAPTPPITSATVVANPNGYAVDNLPLSFDGEIVGSPATTVSAAPTPTNAFTGLVIDFALATARDRVRAIQLWNNYGGILNDNDGIGAATVTLFDAASNVLFTGPLSAGDGAAPFTTDLPAAVDGVARIRLSDITSQKLISVIGWREIALVSDYEATITWSCSGQVVSALVQGANDGVTLADGILTQTNGPHNLTFNVPADFTGQIVTDTPAAFSSLDVTDGTVVTLTGNTAVQFSVVEATDTSEVIAGTVTYDPTTGLPTVRDANTGAVVTGAVIVPCSTASDDSAALAADNEYEVLCDNQDGTVVPFLRRYTTTGTGTVLSTDTELDGVTGYAPLGVVEKCGSGCDGTCETLQLCDGDGGVTDTIEGLASSGVLANDIEWTATGASGSTPRPPRETNDDGSWWGVAAFPHQVTAPVTWTFDTPVDVEFSVWMVFSSAAAPGQNTTQLPVGIEPVSLPAGYTYDPATRVLSVDATRAVPPPPCGDFVIPSADAAARFRTTAPVTSLQVDYLGTAVAVCGRLGNFAFGSVAVVPSVTTFLRTVCRDCAGEVTTVVDTALDGVTPYVTTGVVRDCSLVALEPVQDCCQPETVCLQQNPLQVVEFISNEAHAVDNSVDPVWQWTPAAPDPASPWYDMYRTNNFGGAWTVTDTDTDRPAWWVSPHPNGQIATTGLPNEGPTLGNQHWFARAFFDLPATADPSSIQVQATVFNADQMATAFRLNTGAWQPVPNASHLGPPYTFGPAAIPGAQAGTNELLLDINETVPGGGGAGLMVHLIVTYQIGRPARRQWTRMLCCDGTFYYLDEAGTRQEMLPDGWSIAPCGSGGGADAVVLCDDNGAFLRHVTYTADGDVLVSDTTLDGAAYAPIGTVVDCAAAEAACQDTTTLVLCDDAASGGAPAAINIGGLANGPTGGTLPNGVDFTVNQGLMFPYPQGDTYTFTADGPTQTWTFDEPVAVTFSVRQTAFGGGQCVILPAGSVLQALHPNHTYNPATRELCTISGNSATVSTFTHPGATSLAFTPVNLPTSQGITFMQVTPTAGAGGVTQFLRSVTRDCETGAITITDTTLDGSVYAPVGTVEACGGPADADAGVLAGIRRITGVPNQQLAVEFPGLQSVTLTVLAGFVSVTASSGLNQVIPAGVSLTWSVNDTGDASLAAPWTVVGTDNTADYILNWTYKL